jgi:hypothetical protein
VESATAVEAWLNVFAVDVADLRYDAKPWSQIKDQVRAAVTERLRPEDRDAAMRVLDEADRLLQIRNGLVHGTWLWGETSDGVPGFETQRPPRSKAPPMWARPDGQTVPRWTKETFTLRRLWEFANDCQRVAATFQHRSTAWTEHLHPTD